MLQSYIHWLSIRYKPVIFGMLALTLCLGWGAGNLQITNDFRIYFGKTNPQLSAFEHMERVFGKQESVYFYVQAVQGDLFTQRNLTLIHELTQAGWTLPYAVRVNSLTNHQHTRVTGDELNTEYLVRDPARLTATDIARIRDIALHEPDLVNSAVAADGKATGIVVRLELPGKKDIGKKESVYAARELLQKMREKYPELIIKLAGSATSGVVLGEAVGQDMQVLMTASYLILISGLMLLLRSVRGMLITVVLFTLATAVVFGVYGWAGTILTPVAGWVPSIVMTIGVADCVHILISYFHGLRNGMSRQNAVRESLRINTNPVFITSLTTIIGVLCLNFSDSPPYQDLGNMVALGVFYAWVLSMTLLPALLFWFNIGNRHVNRGEVVWMDRLAGRIIRHRRLLLIGMSCWVIAAACFIPNNEITERWHEYFDESFEQRTAIEAISANLSGVHSLNHIVETGKENGIHDPAVLAKLDAMADWYRRQPGVVHVHSLADIQKRLNRNMHGDKAEWYRVPENRELAAQLFLLYEIGLPRELNMDNIVSLDRSQTLLRVVLRKTDSERILALERAASQWIKDNVSGFHIGEATGLDIVFAHITRRNIYSLLNGSLLALVLISIALIFALQSVRLGLLSLAPNLIPAALAYGTWGILVGRVDLSTSIVLCMSLGIVVDDTVHFLSKYLRARREKNLDVEQGMRYAFNTVGVALTITTIVLVSGFMVLTLSHFSPTWMSGLLLSVTLAYALLADFFFLPPLLMALDKRAYMDSHTRQ
ncbi:MAG: MMPL family transporter [Gammaproteobacteria bacterium]|nr:MMPL family transporter [Gammaproteobacteria bacterium]MDH5650674.1 MMPL family transporter [Gammaproteobacteria bacterium]